MNKTIQTLALETLSDFALGALPIVATLAGIAAAIILPLVWLARSLGTL